MVDTRRREGLKNELQLTLAQFVSCCSPCLCVAIQSVFNIHKVFKKAQLSTEVSSLTLSGRPELSSGLLDPDDC